MKVLMVSKNLIVNGISSVILNYLGAMDLSNLQIDLVCGLPVDNGNKESLEKLGVNVIVLKDRNKRPFKYYKNLFKLMKRGDYNIFHLHTNSCIAAIDLVLARKAKIPKRIAHCHNSSCDHKILHKILWPLFKESYTDGLACSELAGEWLFRKRPYTILFNGIDVGRFRFNEGYRKEIRAEFGVSDDTFLIGNVATFSKVKNHSFLVDVFKEYHDENCNSKLLLVGTGKTVQEIKDKVRNLNLETAVIFAGVRKDIYKIYSAMDVFVLPSLYEGLGIVMIEAEASGLRCVASTGVPKTADLIGDNSFIDLDNSKWIQEIRKRDSLDRNISSEQNVRLIRDCEYDICSNASKLKDVYLGDRYDE